MIIKSIKKFDKQFNKLTPKLKIRVKEKIALFAQDPYNIILNNHLLHGKLEGKRAFSISYDLRIVFEEHDGYVLVMFLDIGDHDSVYR